MFSTLRLLYFAICGAAAMSLLSAAQKYIMDWSMAVQGFIVPCLFGAITGGVFYIYTVCCNRQKKTEELLAARENQLETVLSSGPIGIGVVVNRVFHEVNDFFCEMTGYSKVELLGSSSRLVYPSDEDYDYVTKYKYSQIKETGSGSVETRFRHKDGTILHIILSSKPLDRNDLSKGVTFTAVNISKRKEAEKSLSRRIVFEHLVSEVASDFLNMSVGEIDTGLTKALGDICKFTGVGRAYIFLMRGKSSVCDNTHEWCAENIEPQIHNLQNIDLKEPKTLLWETICKKKAYYIPDVSSLPDNLPDKEILQAQDIWSVLIEPMFFNDELVGFVGFDSVCEHRQWSDEDIDILSLFSNNLALVLERKKVQEKILAAKLEAERANAAKSEFLANMSHEIRTPLNGIMGMLQLLQMSGLNPQQEENHNFAMESCKRLTSLLSDILDITMIESGHLQIMKTEFDLPEALDSIHALFKPVAVQKNIDLQFNVPNNLPSKLIGDSNRLHQIFNNLIGNALKFTNEGSVLVEAYPLRRSQDGNHKILFSVSDSGIGIEDDKLQSIFNSFTQVDASRARNYEGAGLGLAIVKKLLELMGGGLSLVSEVNVGTTIYFYLDFTEVGEASGSISNSRLSEVNPIRKMNVLVAEDEKVNQLTLKKFVEQQGCIVTVANDGSEVMDILYASHDGFDLIFMDIQMPKMGGLEVTSRIRAGELGESVKEIPIIACTAYAMSGDKEEFLSAGMNDYLAKPTHVDDVKNILVKYSKL